MPSPGSTAINACMRRSSARPGRFESLDVGHLAEQVAELVGPLEQAMAGKGLELEGNGSRRQSEREPLEVDLDGSARMGHEPASRRLAHGDGQQAVLQRVAAKDVGDLGADHCTK